LNAGQSAFPLLSTHDLYIEVNLRETTSWRCGFYVNVPFGLLCAFGIQLFLGRRADRPLAARFD
jgi:hypothetical protein